MKSTPRLIGAVVAGIVVALHLPFLPPSLEDLDSINFALGIRDFDPSRHQPHPPGYPLFMAAARLLHAAGLSEVHALSLLSVIGGAVAVFGLFALFETLDRDRPPGPLTWMAVVLVITCPLYWITSARPLSDASGLGASLVVQGLIVTATGVTPLAWAAFAAAFAAGIRSQVVWLTLPLLILAVVRLPRTVRGAGARRAFVAYAAGALVWFVPLILASGGPLKYWRAFFDQGAEDLTGVVMLYTTPTVRQLAAALQSAFVAPWGYWQAAAAALVLAAAGFIVMLRQSRSALITLVCAFGPYLIFDLLFQETITIRYALPLVIPVVYLAVRGMRLLPPTPAMTVALAFAAASAVADDRALYGFTRMPAPAFRMLGDMQAAQADDKSGALPVLAMHRREEYDMRRPITWTGEAMPRFASRLTTPPKHEWLELVKYWNGGGRAPIWFIADPLRSDLALVRMSGRKTLYRWPFDLKGLLGGARPNEVDWHVIDPPLWYLGEGWSLTPETAGVAREDHRGPGYAPITGWVRRFPSAMTLMIGGRYLAPGGSAHVRVSFDGQVVDELDVAPGFFLQSVNIPAPPSADGYAEVRIEATSPEIAIEQFDAQPAGRLIYGFGEGWHEQEYNPNTGALWRWTSDRAVIRLRAEGHGAALAMSGEIEAASRARVTIRAGDRVVGEFEAGRTFSQTVLIPRDALAAGETSLAIETSASYVPAETRWRWRSGDRRRLGLKMLECVVTPVS